MLQQDDAFQVVTTLTLPEVRAKLGEIVPRHDVGHAQNPIAVNLTNALLAVGEVGDRHNGIRMSVVDVLKRKTGMQESLDRWNGGRGKITTELQLVDHRRVGKLIQLEQAETLLHVDGGKAGWLDVGQIPTATLDVKQIDLLSEQIGLSNLHRGIPAAGKDQGFISAQKSGSVYAKA